MQGTELTEKQSLGYCYYNRILPEKQKMFD
jgi:hypothetical protein